MIFLFTDFGAEGPYLGQMEAVLRSQAPGVEVINLLSNAPAGDPRRSAYLLAALCRDCPAGSVILGVVDPGVGGERLPVVLEADGRWFVGPDNGLFNTVSVQSCQAEWRVIDWRPDRLSASFHGRDLFAPIAARIARGDFGWASRPHAGPDPSLWPADLSEIVYVDHYGNAITGRRDGPELAGRILEVQGLRIPPARTFCAVAEGEAFWYGNSMGLVEIAVNLGRADRQLGLVPGLAVEFL
jgi:S-adenosylmethionine hydrolase